MTHENTGGGVHAATKWSQNEDDYEPCKLWVYVAAHLALIGLWVMMRKVNPSIFEGQSTLWTPQCPALCQMPFKCRS